jgi:hypothetical protein
MGDLPDPAIDVIGDIHDAISVDSEPPAKRNAAILPSPSRKPRAACKPAKSAAKVNTTPAGEIRRISFACVRTQQLPLASATMSRNYKPRLPERTTLPLAAIVHTWPPLIAGVIAGAGNQHQGCYEDMEDFFHAGGYTATGQGRITVCVPSAFHLMMALGSRGVRSSRR